VTVQLYTEGDDGEREYLSWEDANGGEYDLGAIWIGAYYENEIGVNEYVGETSIESPTATGDAYTMDVELDREEGIYVYAVVDYWQDSIIGSSEPKGVYPDEIIITDGSENCDIDITILSPVKSGGGGGCSTGTMAITGDAFLTDAYAGGDVAVMLTSTDGAGPYHSDWLTPSPTDDGAQGSYGVTSCASYGEMDLVGAWDSNGNELIDPLDKWGAHVAEVDAEEDANPINIDSDTLTGYNVQIPYGDVPGIGIVPFITLDGSISVKDGTFADFDSGTVVYVTALKYRPDAEFLVETLDDAYDTTKFEWEDLASAESVDFSLVVPSNTIAYLWAYADANANGLLNESGEKVASGGDDDNGKLSTGTESTTDILLELSDGSE
jgi:hypothetical protein